jgi:hypothetical protein
MVRRHYPLQELMGTRRLAWSFLLGDPLSNGPPARLFQGNKVIEAWVDAAEAAKMSPTLAFVDEKNVITKVERGARP